MAISIKNHSRSSSISKSLFNNVSSVDGYSEDHALDPVLGYSQSKNDDLDLYSVQKQKHSSHLKKPNTPSTKNIRSKRQLNTPHIFERKIKTAQYTARESSENNNKNQALLLKTTIAKNLLSEYFKYNADMYPPTEANDLIEKYAPELISSCDDDLLALLTWQLEFLNSKKIKQKFENNELNLFRDTIERVIKTNFKKNISKLKTPLNSKRPHTYCFNRPKHMNLQKKSDFSVVDFNKDYSNAFLNSKEKSLDRFPLNFKNGSIWMHKLVDSNDFNFDYDIDEKEKYFSQSERNDFYESTIKSKPPKKLVSQNRKSQIISITIKNHILESIPVKIIENEEICGTLPKMEIISPQKKNQRNLSRWNFEQKIPSTNLYSKIVRQKESSLRENFSIQEKIWIAQRNEIPEKNESSNINIKNKDEIPLQIESPPSKISRIGVRTTLIHDLKHVETNSNVFNTAGWNRGAISSLNIKRPTATISPCLDFEGLTRPVRVKTAYSEKYEDILPVLNMEDCMMLNGKKLLNGKINISSRPSSVPRTSNFTQVKTHIAFQIAILAIQYLIGIQKRITILQSVARMKSIRRDFEFKINVIVYIQRKYRARLFRQEYIRYTNANSQKKAFLLGRLEHLDSLAEIKGHGELKKSKYSGSIFDVNINDILSHLKFKKRESNQWAFSDGSLLRIDSFDIAIEFIMLEYSTQYEELYSSYSLWKSKFKMNECLKAFIKVSNALENINK